MLVGARWGCEVACSNGRRFRKIESLFGRTTHITFMLLCLACFAAAAVVGIDLGSAGVKVSVISKNRTLHVARNTEGLKVVPTYFALWNRTRASNVSSTETWNDKTMGEFEWAFGSTAKSQCLRFPRLCLKGLVLGDETHFNLRGYEITGLSIQSLISSIMKEENITDEVQAVVAIPPGMKAREKSFLYAGLTIAGLLTTQFVDTTVAPAHLYALEKTSKFKNGTKVVAFVDVGAKGSRASIFNFTSAGNKTSVVQLASQFDETVGGDSLDLRLAELVAPKYNVDLNNAKVKVNFLDDMSAVKEALSIHRSVDLKWEADDDEEETIITVTRDELNSIGGAMNKTLKTLIQDALKQAKIAQVDSVEIVGGASRIPFVQDVIKRELNVTKLGKTVNGDGAVALAAGYMAAESSNEFIVKQIEKSYMLTSECALHSDNRQCPVFSKGDVEEKTLVVPLVAKRDQKFVLVTDSNMPFMAFTLKNISDNTKVNITFVQNYFLMPIPLETVTDSGEKVEMEFESVGWELSPEGLAHSQELTQRLIELQLERRANEKAASDFEGLLLKLARLCISEEAILDTEKAFLRKLVDTEMEWFQSQLSNPPTEAFLAKIKRIEEQTNEIVSRTREVAERAAAIKKLEKTALKLEKTLEELEANPSAESSSMLRNRLTFHLKEAKRILGDSETDAMSMKQCRATIKEALKAMQNTDQQENLSLGGEL